MNRINLSTDGADWRRFIILISLFLSSCAMIETRIPDEPDGFFQKAKTSEQEKATTTTTATLPAAGPLRINVEEAVLQSLEHNRAFMVERLTPAIRRTMEQDARAAFDPLLSAGGSVSKSKVERENSNGVKTRSVTKNSNADVSLSEFFPTGTTLGLDFTTNRSGNDNSGAQNSSRAGISVTQSLLQGFGLGPNLANLRQARLDTLSSEFELRGYAQSLVAQVEETYWDCVLAERQMEIYKKSLEVAESQLSEAEERVRLEKLAESELYAAKSEVALRKEALINANSALQKTRLNLLRLLNPAGDDPFNRNMTLLEEPRIPTVQMAGIREHLKIAKKWRPDLNQARLQIKKGDLELVKTRNGLLPVMDVFINLGKTGYADSFRGSVDDISDGESSDWTTGFQFSYPLGNRAARARNKRAELSLLQSQEALENLDQLAQVDVRTAYIEVNRTREQVDATAVTRQFQEESLRVETEKFRVGKSTSILVAQAQRDLLSSQIAEIQSVINYHKAIIELYRLDGSLLERRRISAPGNEPVVLAATRQ